MNLKVSRRERIPKHWTKLKSFNSLAKARTFAKARQKHGERVVIVREKQMKRRK